MLALKASSLYNLKFYSTKKVLGQWIQSLLCVGQYTNGALLWTANKFPYVVSGILYWNYLVTIVDGFCRLFFRRHCNLYDVSYCGMDTQRRRWVYRVRQNVSPEVFLAFS